MHGCRSLRGFAAYRAKLICGFAACRAELRLAASPPPVRKASGFPLSPRVFGGYAARGVASRNFKPTIGKPEAFRTGGGKAATPSRFFSKWRNQFGNGT